MELVPGCTDGLIPVGKYLGEACGPREGVGEGDRERGKV